MAASLKIRYTDEFIAMTDEIESDRIVEHIGDTIRNLLVFPDMGNPQPRTMLRRRYGDDIRTVVIDGYVLVYRHDEDTLWLIALPWGAAVR